MAIFLDKSIEILINKITRGEPNHLSIEFNPQWVLYQTVKEYLDDDDKTTFENEREKQKCIETNTLWEILYYPNTPICFYCVGASTLELALQTMVEVLKSGE